MCWLSLIEQTLSNRNWALGKLAADAEMPVERINELLEGDRTSDIELQKLAQQLNQRAKRRLNLSQYQLFSFTIG